MLKIISLMESLIPNVIRNFYRHSIESKIGTYFIHYGFFSLRNNSIP